MFETVVDGNCCASIFLVSILMTAYSHFMINTQNTMRRTAQHYGMHNHRQDHILKTETMKTES
jgi:hypothetical protein